MPRRSHFHDSRNRAVVLGRDEDDALGREDLALQAFHGSDRLGFVVLVIERHIADLQLFEFELLRRQPGDSVSELPIDGVAAMASHDEGNPILIHV
jgi:hypothetical protein